MSKFSKSQPIKRDFINTTNITKLYKSGIIQPFEKKINELHFQITKNSVKINKIMCKTFVDLLCSDSLKEYLEKLNSNQITNLNNKIAECIYDVSTINNVTFYKCNYESTDEDFIKLVLNVNKFCELREYNDTIIKRLNDDFDFLMDCLETDKNVLTKINKDVGTEQFYIKILRFIKQSELLKVFKLIPEQIQTYPICRVVLDKEYKAIKYVHNQTEDMCLTALALGHTNLGDIKPKFHSVKICTQYVDINIENLSHITAKSNLPESFFKKYLKQNPANVKYIDSRCMTISLNTQVVSADGLLIKYIKPEFQTVRLINLACDQNHLAKYYVTYDFPVNLDVFNLIEIVNTHLKSSNFLGIPEVLQENLQKAKEEFNRFTKPVSEGYNHGEIKISMIKDLEKIGMYVMTPENYVNYQYRLRIEKGFKQNFDILIDKEWNTLLQKRNNRVRTEYSSVIKDLDNNEYVVLIENLTTL